VSVILILLTISPIVAVAATEEAPVLDVIGDCSVNEDHLLFFTLHATDYDNDSLSFSGTGLPVGSNLDESTGLFEWTPTYEQSGSYLVQFVVSNGDHIDSEYITITVNDVNRLPVFPSISDATVNENEQVQLVLEASDLDGDILTFSKDASFGNLQGNVFTWVPDYNDDGEHTITFTVNDSFSPVTQTVRISVSNVNRKPVLYSISDTSVPLNNPVEIQLNGYDPDGDDLIYSIVSGFPEGASFDSDTGLFQWPNPDSAGVFYLQFIVDDGFTTDTKTAKIVIGDSNLPPVIDSMEAQSIDENSELSFEISASDPNNNKLSFSYPDDLPSGATLTMSSSSVRFEWTPSYEQAGNYKVEFRVSDNSKYSFASYEVVDITVSDVNRPPVIDAVDDYSISENSVLYINLSGNDPDNDPLTFSTDSTLETVRGNLFTFSPDYSDAGVYNIQFTASDGSLSDSTTATITVTDANMPPKINSINPLKVAVNTTLEFSLSVSDDEKDALTYMALDLPSDANFDDSKALFEWTPSSSQIGDYSVSFHVSDASFEDYETVSITVVNESSSSGDTTSSSSSGSGGGGGSQNTGEKYENIDLKDYSIKSVMRDVETIFEFDEPANNIVSISFVSRLNGGQTKALIEILKGTSTLVNSAPAGKVYKNLNIWIGDSKFPSDMIYDVVITFRVDKSWIHSNELDSQSVKLYRGYLISS